jgi:hypothetical protein
LVNGVKNFYGGFQFAEDGSEDGGDAGRRDSRRTECLIHGLNVHLRDEAREATLAARHEGKCW